MPPRKKKKKKTIAPSAFARVYYDPDRKEAYGGATELAKAVPGATVQAARQWLEGQVPYNLYRPSRRRFEHDPIVVKDLDDQWAADLIDVQRLASQNGGHKYLLTVIDSLSKYAFVRPIKDKRADTVARAFKAIFAAENRVPRKLRTDMGKEFLGEPFQKLLKSKKIRFFTAKNYTKEAFVERFNRTLRGRLWRFFEATNSRAYLKVLPKLVSGYNERVHSSTGMAPSKVTPYNAHVVWNRLYGHLVERRRKRRVQNKKPKPPGYRLGDRVRLSKAKLLFEQGYKSNWTREIFSIHAAILTPLGSYRYKVRDAEGEIIQGSFLSHELQRVQSAPKEIAKTVKRSRDGKWVQWRGHPQALTTWVPKQGQ